MTGSSPLDLSVSIAHHSGHGPDPLDVLSDGFLYRTTTTSSPYRICHLDVGAIEVGAEHDLDVVYRAIPRHRSDRITLRPNNHDTGSRRSPGTMTVGHSGRRMPAPPSSIDRGRYGVLSESRGEAGGERFTGLARIALVAGRSALPLAGIR